MTLEKHLTQNTACFYKTFWEDLKVLLFNALNECIMKGELMTSMKQGLITLIPKPGKDKRFIINLRPITLLNLDCKLLTGVLAKIKIWISENNK